MKWIHIFFNSWKCGKQSVEDPLERIIPEWLDSSSNIVLDLSCNINQTLINHAKEDLENVISTVMKNELKQTITAVKEEVTNHTVFDRTTEIVKIIEEGVKKKNHIQDRLRETETTVKEGVKQVNDTISDRLRETETTVKEGVKQVNDTISDRLRETETTVKEGDRKGYSKDRE